jgi:UDP-glucose 4-epimerase
MKLLITGGAGYIGSHVLNLCGEAEHEIVVLDNLSTGRKESILYGRHAEFSIEETARLDELFKKEKFEAVIHFAGSIVVPESVIDPLKYYENNTLNSLSMIKMCLKYGVKNFIFSSTAAIYGDSAPDGICREESLIAPLNPYGHSKYMTEVMLESTALAHDFNYVALRYFNVAGANVELKIGQCTPNATHLIKIACECATGKRDEMQVYGEDYDTPDGTCIRDYIHVDDLAMAHMKALGFLIKEESSVAVNCGYGNGFSVHEVIKAVKEVSGVDFKVNMGPRRAGDAARLISRADKIKEIFGWQPKYQDLNLIVRTALEWERNLAEK